MDMFGKHALKSILTVLFKEKKKVFAKQILIGLILSILRSRFSITFIS